MQHLIKKQTINLTLSKQADAFRLQQLVSGHYRQEVLPLLEDVFNELSDEEEVIRIEQLEIDLGILSEKEISQGQWDKDILSGIKSQLQEKIGRRENKRLIRHEITSLGICKQWLFYMQKGYLPWNTLYVDEAWYARVLEALAVDFANVAELRKIIKEIRVVSRRIILQHDENFLIKLMEILTASRQKGLPSAIDAAVQLITSPISAGVSPIELKRKIWEQVLQLAASRQAQQSAGPLTETILIQNILPVVRKLYEKPELFLETKPSIGINRQKEKDNKETKQEHEIDEEGIFVQHAGMVLIHPFLPSLFKRLQLATEGKFVTTASQQKAILLLHYIAAGTTAGQEYELVVPKILCEWPLQMPVEIDRELSADELNETDNMLQAAIEQWAVLKNTSMAGLREGFLQRKGKLFTKNDNMHLQVVTNSIDVLLDQLPWNLSMIKLSWMKGILRVEWR